MLRLIQRFSVLSAIGLGLSAAACSSEPNPHSNGSGGSSGGSFDFETNPEPASCTGAVRPTNDAYCHPSGGCSLEPDCARASARPVDACCVLTGAPGQGPTRTLERTTETEEYADPAGGPVALGCFENPPTAGAERPVTMKGVVESFASGCDLVGVKVEVYTVKRSGDPTTDGEPDQLIGTPVVTDDSSPIALEPAEKCDPDPRKNREYSYPDVPLYKELLVKTSGVGQGTWTTLYTYNVYITEDDPDFDAGTDTYTRNVQALAADDFQTIPTVAIGTTITPGNGAVGGEIHDCDNVRIKNARVDVSATRKELVFFDDNEDNPLPDVNRRESGTGATALYSALDVKPNSERPVRIAATGLIERGSGLELVSLGYFDVRVFPNSVTSCTLRGRRAFQAAP
jgi:hypothetical protein